MSKESPFQRVEHKNKHTRFAKYKVHGFWSGNNVTVAQSRAYSRDQKWEAPQINWSSGGRDCVEEPDGIAAASAFQKAVADAVKIARKWNKDTGQ